MKKYLFFITVSSLNLKFVSMVKVIVYKVRCKFFKVFFQIVPKNENQISDCFKIHSTL